jgi:hypothetical protein
MPLVKWFLFTSLLVFTASALGQTSAVAISQTTMATPGKRTTMDAHNCYPYFEWWNDRIDRALSAGTPVAIEQDLAWYTDPKTGKSWSIVTHGAPYTGQAPIMDHYFFDRVRPIVEKALASKNHSQWPIITLNLDFKTEEPEHLAAVLALLQQHKDWLTTATKAGDGKTLSPLDVKPILVLTGASNAQQKVFYDDLPDGARLLVFGAVHTDETHPLAAPEVLESEHATNYRRWWNNPWQVVEEGGQTKAGDWTPHDNARLTALVQHAHTNQLWIRFYTLDGATTKDLSCNGWFHSYNFGSLSAAKERWKAAQTAGVDYVASDQYELLGATLRSSKSHASQ